jgi:glycosyltransferase involved in cell wall biosynthesis
VTVSTRTLQKRYGGTVVRHGPAGEGFDPDRPDLQDRAALRRRWQLPLDVPLALFAGVPQPHKGWPVLTAALTQPQAQRWHLVIAGAPEHPEFQTASRALPGRCHVIGLQRHDMMPYLLAAIDAVPLPQLDVRFARSQLPAKLVEAMAMARSTIATRVGDLPDIIGDNERGWLIPPADPGALARALDEIARMPALARTRGRAARAWYLAEASQTVVERRVSQLIDRLVEGAPVLAPSKRAIG